MFHWHKEIDRLDIPAAKVFHLARSLSAVQVALPGLPSQEATAYLCVFSPGKGLRVALVLHLLTSRRLAFYLHDEEAVPQQEASRLIEAGSDFAESLGFMLSDVDYRKLGTQQRASLWGSLPLKNGIETPAPLPDLTTATREVEGIAPPRKPVTGRASAAPPVQFTAPADEVKAEILEEPEVPEELELPVELGESVGSDGPERPEEPEIPEELELPVEFEEPEMATEVELSFKPEDTAPQARKLSAAADDSESEIPLDSGLIQRPVASGEVPTVRPPTQKTPPSAEEATVSRRKLLESLGRFLASL